MITLHTTALSANGRKPLALVRHLGLEVTLHEVDVYRGGGLDPAYRRLNPLGKVPTLVDGELVLWESNAILQYLSDAYGAERVCPVDAKGRAEVARWLFWESAHWQPALVEVLSNHVGHVLLPDVVPAAEREPSWGHPQLAPLLTLLGDRLEGRRFLTHEEPSLADFSVAAMTTYFRRVGFPSDAYPAIGRWLERMEEVPAWAETTHELWGRG